MDNTFEIFRTPDSLILREYFFEPKFALYPDNLTEDKIATLIQYKDSPWGMSKKNRARHSRVDEAWKALSCVNQWNARTFRDILIILLDTNPSFKHIGKELPPLDFALKDTSTKKTAAHPRGIPRKTKRKPRPPESIQPYLCHKKYTRQLLQGLAPLWPKTRALLKKEGYDPASLDRLEFNGWDQADPYFSFHFDFRGDPKTLKLPEPFQQILLPKLRGNVIQEVKKALALYWALSLHDRFHLLLAVSDFYKRTTPGQAHDWTQIINSIPPRQHLLFAGILVWSALFKEKPITEFDQQALIRICNSIPEGKESNRLVDIIYALKDGVPLDYLDYGFQLSDKHFAQYSFYTVGKPLAFNGLQLDTLLKQLSADGEFSEYQMMNLWSSLTEFPIIQHALDALAFERYSPLVGRRLLRIFTNCDGEGTPAFRKNKFEFLLTQIPDIENTLKEIPEDYHEVFMTNLEDFIRGFNRVDSMKRTLPHAYCFLSRVCRPPYGKGSEGTLAFYFLLHYMPTTRVHELLEAPESSFLKLESACKTENNSRLIRRGLAYISWKIPELALDGFIKFPSKLFQVSKALGVLSRPQKIKIMKSFEKHPLIKMKLKSISAKALHQLIEKKYTPDIPNPIPKNLRKSLNNEITLTPAREANYTRKFKDKIPLTRLQLLENEIWKKINSGFQQTAPSEDWRHTLQMFYWMDNNRRSLKKFLNAYAEGHHSFLKQHPRTQGWIKRHSRVPINAWQNGLRFIREVPGHGRVQIKVEDNPLEILKMGTYVGSCLSLGGYYADNAAAVLLDINKQVLFARNSKNNVLARQLLAISNDNKLVCFSVYPQNAPREIKQIFFQYNKKYSEFLGLPLFRGDPDDDGNGYEIEGILSKDWYDDSPWFKWTRK